MWAGARPTGNRTPGIPGGCGHEDARLADGAGRTDGRAADVLVANVAWGTRLDASRSYAAEDEDYDASPGAEYALVVRTRDGRAEQVATWRGLPGRTMRLSAATATSRSEIETVEMRTADGVVLRLTV